MTRQDHITQARRYIRAARRFFDEARDTAWLNQDQIDMIIDEAQANRAWARDHLEEAYADRRRAA